MALKRKEFDPHSIEKKCKKLPKEMWSMLLEFSTTTLAEWTIHIKSVPLESRDSVERLMVCRIMKDRFGFAIYTRFCIPYYIFAPIDSMRNLLTHACTCGDLTMVRFLVEKYKQPIGMNEWHMASKNANLHIIDFFRTLNPSPSPECVFELFFVAAQNDDLRISQYFYTHFKAEIDAKIKKQKMVLIQVIIQKSACNMLLWIHKTFGWTLETESDEDCYFFLILASGKKEQNVKIMTILHQKYGITGDQARCNKYRLLKKFAIEDNYKALECLHTVFEFNIKDVCAANMEPFILAAEHGSLSCVKYFMEKFGVTKDHLKISDIMLMNISRHLDVLKYLDKHFDFSERVKELERGEGDEEREFNEKFRQMFHVEVATFE